MMKKSTLIILLTSPPSPNYTPPFDSRPELTVQSCIVNDFTSRRRGTAKTTEEEEEEKINVRQTKAFYVNVYLSRK